MKIELTGLSNFKEIQNVSGRGVSFKKISIANEDCSNFQIKYKIIDQLTFSESSGYINCLVSPYQRNVSEVALINSIIIPENCKLLVQMHSAIRQNFTGKATIEYDTFIPSEKRVFISENDRQNAFRLALVNLARLYDILDYEYLNNQAIYDILKKENPPIIKLLEKYFKAYSNWFDFYQELRVIEEQTGQGKKLTEEEQEKLRLFIKAREEALDELQSKFDELQLEKFKKSQGLDNADGIIL